MKKPPAFDYKIDNRYKKEIKCEEAKFIFEQAEKSFNDTIESSKKILERCSTLLTLLSGIIIGLITYSIGRYEKNNCLDSILITSILSAVYYFSVGLFLIFPNIQPTEYTLPGTQPKRYFNDALFNANPPQGRLTLLYLIEIKNIQDGIDENTFVNERRWKIYKKSLYFLFYSPIAIVVAYLLINLVL